MLPGNRTPTHPGEVLQEEFLALMELTQVGLAAHLGIPVQRIDEIVRGERGITRKRLGSFPRPSAPRRSSERRCRRTTISRPTVRNVASPG